MNNNENYTIYPEDWNNETNNINTNQNESINRENKTINQNQAQSFFNPQMLFSFMQKGNNDFSELLKGFMPDNSPLSSLLPLLKTKKTAKAVSSLNKIENKVDTSKFTKVKDYYS